MSDVNEEVKLGNKSQSRKRESFPFENVTEDQPTVNFKDVSNSEQFIKSQISGYVNHYPDEVISLIGDGKRWQILITIILSLFGLCPEFNHILAVSAFYSPPGLQYYCSQYPRFTNWTIQEWMSLSHYNGTDPCKIYALDYNSLPTNYTPNINTPTVACNKTTFSRVYGYTVTEKWNMVCSRDHLISTYRYLFLFGRLLGNIIFGIWCDRRGRRNLLAVCILTQPMFGMMMTSTSSYIIFVVAYSFLGFFLGGAFVLSLIYVVEILGPKKCTLFTGLSFLSIGLSSLTLSFVHFALPHWYHMHLFITVPVVIILVWTSVMEESPRWLLVMLRAEDALCIIKVIAHRNRIKLPPSMKLLSAPEAGLIGEEDDDRHCNIWDVRNYPNLRIMVILLIFLQYGIATILQVRVLRFRILNTSLSTQSAIMGCTELCSVVCTVFMLLKFGHAKVTSISMILYGLLNLFLLIFVHSIEEEDYFMAVLLSIITYFFVIMAYVSTIVYSPRVLPTIIRGSGIGITSAAYNIGIMVVTFISRSTMPDVKVFIVSLSMLSFILALIAYVLPETFDRELPDTLRDGEHFQRRPRPIRWLAREDSDVEEKELASVNLE